MKKIILTVIIALFSGVLFAQTKTEIRTSDLQPPIAGYLEKNLSGYIINKAFRVDDKGVISYEVCVSKDNAHEKLTFDKEGKFLKKESCNADCWKSPVKESGSRIKPTGQPSEIKPIKK